MSVKRKTIEDMLEECRRIVERESREGSGAFSLHYTYNIQPKFARWDATLMTWGNDSDTTWRGHGKTAVAALTTLLFKAGARSTAEEKP